MARWCGIVAVFLACLLASMPAAAEEWFEAYASGLAALRDRQPRKAVGDLRSAIRLRPEPGDDLAVPGGRRIEHYHPYLRLAEAYLQAGELEQAQRALERSEQTGREPSAERARLAAQLARTVRLEGSAARPWTRSAPGARPMAPLAPAATSADALPRSLDTPASAETGRLELSSDPPGASVWLGSQLIGETPLETDLAPGVYALTLRKQGTADSTFTVSIERGRVYAESRALVVTASSPAASTSASAEPITALASLVLYSQPPGATVVLDGETLGSTDPGTGRLVRSGVSPGRHLVRFSMRGHADASQEVEIAAEGPTTVRASLEEASPEQGARTRAPLWIGLGVLLTAGAGALAWRLRH